MGTTILKDKSFNVNSLYDFENPSNSDNYMAYGVAVEPVAHEVSIIKSYNPSTKVRYSIGFTKTWYFDSPIGSKE